MINRKHVDWSRNSTIYEVNLRQYTSQGSIREFLQHIPRLKQLGVNILWFMPVQPLGIEKRKGTLGSYYCLKNFTAIDAAYGTINEFKHLVNVIHNSGMHVILDWVANHTAWDHEWTNTHPDFYKLDANNNFMPPFPEWADVIGLDYNNKDVWREMIQAMLFWVKETDIDGFRCDMAHLVPTAFWEETRNELDKIKPVFMLAETENTDLVKNAFDCLYNWKLFHLLNDLAAGKKKATDLRNFLENEIATFPSYAYQIFFTSNHDENSWAGSAVERLGCALEAMNILIFTLPGMPLIYSGQEAGLDKKLRFFDKDEIFWKKDKMTDFYHRLIKLRKENPALWSGENEGDFMLVNTTGCENIIAFQRKKNTHIVLIMINISLQPITFHILEYPEKTYFRDIFSEKSYYLSNDNEIVMQPWEYLILENNQNLTP